MSCSHGGSAWLRGHTSSVARTVKVRAHDALEIFDTINDLAPAVHVSIGVVNAATEMCRIGYTLPATRPQPIEPRNLVSNWKGKQSATKKGLGGLVASFQYNT